MKGGVNMKNQEVKEKKTTKKQTEKVSSSKKETPKKEKIKKEEETVIIKEIPENNEQQKYVLKFNETVRKSVLSN